MKTLLLFIALVQVNAVAQSNPKNSTKNDATGSWKFEPKLSTQKGQSLIVDYSIVLKIDFALDGSYKFLLQDSTMERGKWDISEDGEALLITERSQIPESKVKLHSLEFPIKTKRGKYITITFLEFDLNNNSKERKKKKFVPIN